MSAPHVQYVDERQAARLQRVRQRAQNWQQRQYGYPEYQQVRSYVRRSNKKQLNPIVEALTAISIIVLAIACLYLGVL